MRCPFCEYAGARSELHLHLARDHPEAVETWTESAGRMRYRVRCPKCEQAHVARVKPRSQDPEFLERFAHEIRLVAFDMLLHHVEGEHSVPAQTQGET